MGSSPVCWSLPQSEAVRWVASWNWTERSGSSPTGHGGYRGTGSGPGRSGRLGGSGRRRRDRLHRLLVDPTKYAGNDSAIEVSSGEEMRLIEAEGLLRAGIWPGRWF